MPSTVRIERLRLEHAEVVQRLASDPAVVAMSNLPSPYPDDGAVTWIQGLTWDPEEGGEYAVAIFSETEGLVGVAGLIVMSREEKGNAELGYWIGRPYWGRGYATNGCRQLLDVGFGLLQMRRVFARTLVRNRASCRVLDKLGFRHIATEANPFSKFDPKDRLAFYEVKRWQWQRLTWAMAGRKA